MRLRKCISSFFMVCIFFLFACKKDFTNLNSPIEDGFLVNASKAQLASLVTGIESGMRIRVSLYLNDVGILGREIYWFSPSEPAYTTQLLGKQSAQLSNAAFYIVSIWAANYRVVKNCNLLEQACNNTDRITASEKLAFIGFAKTIKAYSLLLNVNLTYSNGIRTQVDDPNNLGPILGYNDALVEIARVLESAKEDLENSTNVLSLSAGFNDFNSTEGLIKFNRALAARVSIYRNNWTEALNFLEASFLDPTGNFKTGVYSAFGTGSGDIINPMFIPRNQTGEIRVAHPSYFAEIESGDGRASNAPLRNMAASFDGLSSNHDVWVYTSTTAFIPIIRNEELILMYAEALIQTGNLVGGLKALNIIRNGHGLPNYSGAIDTAALISEMLTQRRYSLYYEGHRWIDLRRYGLLQSLPIDRVGDDVWIAFPLPSDEL